MAEKWEYFGMSDALARQIAMRENFGDPEVCGEVWCHFIIVKVEYEALDINMA